MSELDHNCLLYLTTYISTSLLMIVRGTVAVTTKWKIQVRDRIKCFCECIFRNVFF